MSEFFHNVRTAEGGRAFIDIDRVVSFEEINSKLLHVNMEGGHVHRLCMSGPEFTATVHRFKANQGQQQ